MQIPERLALIGGSILLASTLVFTLKSQASSIIPKVGHSISGVFNHIGDKSNDFDNGYQEAQKKGWKTGNWGSSKFYMDDKGNMHIGQGELQGKLYDTLGVDGIANLKTINFDEDVKAPQDSSWLLSVSTTTFGDGNHVLQNINGLENIDTSQVNNMTMMFNKDQGLKSINLSNWDVSHVSNFQGMFDDDDQMTDINLSGWDTTNATNMSWMFNNNVSLKSLNINTFNTSHADVGSFLSSNNLHEIDLGNDTKLGKQNGFYPGGYWKSGDRTVFIDALTSIGQGNWIRQ